MQLLVLQAVAMELKCKSAITGHMSNHCFAVMGQVLINTLCQLPKSTKTGIKYVLQAVRTKTLAKRVAATKVADKKKAWPSKKPANKQGLKPTGKKPAKG